MGVPAEPMSEFYAALSGLAERQGTDVRLRASVERIERADGVWRAVMSDGEVVSAKAMVLALPFEQAQKLLGTIAEPSAEQRAVMESFAQFVHAPITTIHLWLDREVTEIEQAALLDTRIQWMFNKSRIRRSETGEHYYELVISASHAELKKTREEILDSAIEELKMFFPAARAGAGGAGRGAEGGAGDVFGDAGVGAVSSGAGCVGGWAVSCRRLDEDGLAFDDGERGAEWEDCGGESRESCGWEAAVFDAGVAGEGIDGDAGAEVESRVFRQHEIQEILRLWLRMTAARMACAGASGRRGRRRRRGSWWRASGGGRRFRAGRASRRWRCRRR